MIVTDASALVHFVADYGTLGTSVRSRLRGETIVGHELQRLEVMSIIRKAAARNRLSAEQAASAVADLLELPILQYDTTALLPRVWELRHNLSIYDATYVALAEATDLPLLTADLRLANAPGLRCRIEQLQSR